MDNYYRITPLHIILPKRSAYVESYDGQTKWVYFLMMAFCKNMILFGTKSAQILKKNSIARLSPKHILKIKMKSDKAIDFNDKGISKVDSNHTCLAVINFDSALNKDRNYYIFWWVW